MAQADLADWIEKSKEQLTTDWTDLVRADPRIQSDTDLSENGLRDHIPSVISEICDLLRSNEAPGVINTREGRVHAYVRFRQGYRARELVRELALLRLTLLDFLGGNLANGAAGLTLETYLAAAQIINAYVDEELSYAVSVYAEAMKPAD